MKKFTIFAALVLAAGMLGQVFADSAGNKDRLARKLQTLNSIAKELETSYVDTIAVDEIMDNTIQALLYYTDPYTEYYPSNEQDELLQLSAGGYAGIGSVIGKRGDHIIISDPYWNSPARRYGLRMGDIIRAVDGDTVTPTTDISSVSRHLRGQAGTKVRVDVARPWVGPDSLMSFEIVRDKIETKPVDYYAVLPDSIGYISLVTFNVSAAREVKEALTDIMRHPGLKGVILDLRNNGGGLLEDAVQISGLFLPKGTEVLRTRGRSDRDTRIYKNTRNPIAPELPLVVLVNGGTASSSEIVSGSLQDLDRAVIMGERTFGKGLVQATRPLPFNDLLKITTARYYIPSGRLIQALNYSERTEEGLPSRTPDSLTTEFRTRLGRIVRDGGGITPDIAVTPHTYSQLATGLANDYQIFDFAVRQYARNPLAGAPDSVLVDSAVFEDFKSFVGGGKFDYNRRWESAMKSLRKAIEADGSLNDSVAAQVDALEAALHHDLGYDLDRNREEIMQLLDHALGGMYYSDFDNAARHIDSDSTIARARELLSDPAAYRRILSPAGH